MNQIQQPNSEMCFVCGRANPVGLYMKFFDNGESEVSSQYTGPGHYQSYPGIVHGGVLASMAWQLSEGKELIDLEECIAWGTVSGGYGCFHLGGTHIEQKPGEKLGNIRPYFDHYLKQIHE